MNDMLTLLEGDALEKLKELPDRSVNCCVTSPPYFGLRDYGSKAQIGREHSPAAFINRLVLLYREVHRVLRDDGTFWLNIGDCYTPVNRGEKAKARAENQFHPMQKGHMHADIPTVRASVRASVRAVAEEGYKKKELMMIPARVAIALCADGWYLRNDIIWAKPNPMPESCRDRCTKSHEHLFFFTKGPNYWSDFAAIEEQQVEHERTRRLREQTQGLDTEFKIRRDQHHGQVAPGKNGSVRSTKRRQELAEKGTRNKRDVWTVSTGRYEEAHFAVYPPELVRPCILAGCPPGGTVLDPCGGSGTTGMVALELGRRAVLVELNPDYCKMIRRRCAITPGLAL